MCGGGDCDWMRGELWWDEGRGVCLCGGELVLG